LLTVPTQCLPDLAGLKLPIASCSCFKFFVMELSLNNGESVPQNIPTGQPLPTDSTKAKKKKCSALYAASMWRSTTARVDPHKRHGGYNNPATDTTPLE
jgi:hypothetical protein